MQSGTETLVFCRGREPYQPTNMSGNHSWFSSSLSFILTVKIQLPFIFAALVEKITNSELDLTEQPTYGLQSQNLTLTQLPSLD